MRRAKGSLLPIEQSILRAALDLANSGQRELHGFALARELRDREGARRLTAHGTLYRALDRLEDAGMLEGRLEEAEVAAAAGRPRRHLYSLTGLGERTATDLPMQQQRAPNRSLKAAEA